MTAPERPRRFLRRRGGDGDAWHAVELARHQDRPYTLDYLARFCDDFVELHGDRAEGDDPAIVAGLGSFRGQTVAFVGHQKGRDLKQRAYRNFGMPRPEGYRKAMRVFELAGRLGFPVVTLIDTPGAYPGVGAEQRGQSGAIARSQLLLMGLNVPVVACVIGEGSSGGALALGLTDRVVMLENATYSVISPEGGAAILWRDAGKARDAAAAFQPTAATCYRWGIADSVVPEPPGGAHRDHDEAARLLDGYLSRALRELRALTPADRRRQRRERYRRLGAFRELPMGDGAALVAGRLEPPSRNGTA